MGARFDETMREAGEESCITRGGARFRQENRQRKGEGLAKIKTQDHEGRPHGRKRPYNDEEDDQTQATPRIAVSSNPISNVSTPLCTTPPTGRKVHSTLTCPT